MMIWRRLSIAFSAILAFAGILGATPAAAQATRTWVSGVGDDANPCSRTAPCKTFAGAISKTATGGEINCLDPGGFGGVTIVKSISIICDYTEGGVLSAGAGVNGIVVNLPAATDTVFLSGLDLNGAGNAQNGLRVVSGGTVHLRNSIIRNYRASNGLGISYQPAGAGRLHVTDTTIADNGTGATGGGILVQPTGAGGSARIELVNVRIQDNSNAGLRIDTTGNTAAAGIRMQIDDSIISGNPSNGITVNSPAGTSAALVTVTGSNVSNNGGNGITASGSANAFVLVGTTVIQSNASGLVRTGGGEIRSFGDNLLNINIIADGTFSGTAGKS